jgi:magnesium transporter
MSLNVAESKGINWYHISQITDADLEKIQGTFKFHHLDYEDIKTKSPISKMDTYKHYVFAVFHIPVVDQEQERVYGEELYVFLSKDSLVTISHKALPAVEQLFRRVTKSSKFRGAVVGKGTAATLHKILNEAFKDSLSVVAELTREVKRLEKAIEQEHDKTLTVDLGHARRNVLFLRHIVGPQRSIINSLSSLKRSYIPAEMDVYFDDVDDILDTVWLSADNLKLIIDGLFDVNEALLSHKTNEVVTLLTIVSAALMVPTFIAGFYGMNVPWLPFANNAQIVSMLYIISFLVMVALVIAVVRRPRT